MIPTQVREPFHRDGWVYEEKVDGPLPDGPPLGYDVRAGDGVSPSLPWPTRLWQDAVEYRRGRKFKVRTPECEWIVTPSTLLIRGESLAHSRLLAACPVS